MRPDQIVFTSLLMGLMAGPQTVSVDTPANLGIARVEFRLDGQSPVTVTEGEPRWQAEIDFGQLSPHELTAIARDASGKEVGTATRLVNLPEPPARLEILIVRNGLGEPVAARLVATSTLRDAPLRRELRLDGSGLQLDDRDQAALPKLEMSTPHILSGEAAFAEDVVAHADVAIGGGIQEEAGSRLTAVPVRVRQRLLPSADSLGRAFTRKGMPLKVVAVERGRATVVIVRHPNSLEASRRIQRPLGGDPLKLESKDSVGFVWPLTKTLPGGSERTTLFESTSYFPGSTGGFYWLLTRVSRPGSSVPPYRLADAVAIAGLKTYAEGSRRAVILIEGSDRADASQFAPGQVKAYLSRIGTPLHVWSLARGAQSPWTAEPEDVASSVGLQSAVNRLRQDLGSQGIVWLAGEWSPTDIELTAPVESISLLSREAKSN